MTEQQNDKSKVLQTQRTTLIRRPERGRYDFPTIAAILDEAYICNIGFVLEGQPYVLPTAYGREGHAIYFHAHWENRMLNVIGKGIPICFTTMILDGLVLGKSAFRHSMNYRSVVVLGRAKLVPEGEKEHALRVITSHVIPGRWEDVRAPKQEELDKVVVVKLMIEEASAKVRTGPPVDLEEDHGRDVWSGVIPVSESYHKAVPAPDCGATAPVPKYATSYRRPTNR
jgi:nitroimidazol reductase NimA-like FMN-containing flavoprotein (pyridoxamine 5'-phosphate oxidase superfamily)